MCVLSDKQKCSAARERMIERYALENNLDLNARFTALANNKTWQHNLDDKCVNECLNFAYRLFCNVVYETRDADAVERARDLTKCALVIRDAFRVINERYDSTYMEMQ
jgi:hypothetical protein